MGIRRGLVGASVLLYLPRLFFLYRFYGSKGKHVEQAYPFLKGVGREALRNLAREVFTERIRPRIDRAVADRIAAIQREGGEVAIASSSFGLILEPLAAYLGIDAVVASELEFKDGKTTGRVDGEPAFGGGKKSRMLAYLDGRGTDPADCAFYSDSSHDLPLLRAVGKPVAVNPNGALRRIARNEGWELLETKSRGGRS